MMNQKEVQGFLVTRVITPKTKMAMENHHVFFVGNNVLHFQMVGFPLSFLSFRGGTSLNFYIL